MLFLKEITMNCAFFVRSLIYDATMETWKPHISEHFEPEGVRSNIRF